MDNINSLEAQASKVKLTAYLLFAALFKLTPIVAIWENKDNIIYKFVQSIETFRGSNKQRIRKEMDLEILLGFMLERLIMEFVY